VGFCVCGCQVLKGYILIPFVADILKNSKNSSDFKKIYPLYAKLIEAMMLLHPMPLAYPHIGMINITAQNSRSILQKKEKSFADEINAFYYINLHNESSLIDASDKSLNCTPKQCLSSILEQDKCKPLLREWFAKWMEDLKTYQEEVLQNIKAASSIGT
jgi:hypothetical protein